MNLPSIYRKSLLRLSCVAVLAFALILSSASAMAADANEPFAPPAGPRSRVLYINDLNGDIDGLFATVHIALSPAIELRGIVGTGPGEANGVTEAKRASELAETMLSRMGRSGKIKVYEGCATKLASAKEPMRAPGVQAIIDEALRTDTKLPLYVAVGGGLTEVASALMIEPSIADRFTLVWIGGGRAHPGGARYEPNFGIDPLAAQYIFNETQVPIWHVPSEVYQTTLISDTELQAYVAPNGAIGEWLYNQVIEMSTRFKSFFNTGETWSLGDSPLVVLTALNDWVPNGIDGVKDRAFKYQRTGSSTYEEMIAPRLDELGMAVPRESGRIIRRYKSIDNRLMFSDFFAKLRINNLKSGSSSGR